MGYFSNGTEGDIYAERYCMNCVHFMGCAVWNAHQLYNYRECNKADSILHLLIPMEKEGIGNEKCLMFYEASEEQKAKIIEELGAW